ncbi:motility associated factor glycosyltransferase family protein [Clostridium butyricum]|uniref:motility associated factor glycosyltransferase family protein n=1 Tax=Clostridium butyricum TaxID=1492 RepID=UPI00241C2C38|nr:6-hydroxymethylpterin diphosphokinase MptE-like protein [Clostridium butyricum]
MVENHNGCKIFSFSSEEMYSFLDKEPKVLSTYGSVAHSMVSVAILLGCNPIIFIGQDFAYTNDSAHSEYLDTKHNSWKFNQVKSNTDFFVEGVGGGKVRTSIILDLYRRGMEKIIQEHPDIKFVNATEGGARMNGTEEMTFCDAIKRYKGFTIEHLKSKSVDSRVSIKIANKVHEMYEDLENIRKETKKAIIYTQELERNFNLNKMNNVCKLLKKLDDIDQYIKEKINSFLIIQSLLYPIIYKILTNKNIENKLEKNQKIKNIIDQNTELYNAINEVIERTLKDFDKVDKKLNTNRESEKNVR